jgi:hypothetical protein
MPVGRSDSHYFLNTSHYDNSPECDGCDGSGIRAPAAPSCRFDENEIREWTIVERCDTCERYPDDLTAALAMFREARWVLCAEGSHHAIGRM